MPLLNKIKENHILHLQLDDPESLNAFSPYMAEDFYRDIEYEPYYGLLVSAKGPWFCSGGNLKFYKDLQSKEEGIINNERITFILDRLSNLRKPTVCVVEGPCLGGGVEFASAFDQVFATPGSLFGLWQRRIGLTLGWGGEDRLVKKLGAQRLKSWLYRAQTVSAYKAHQWGLVDQLVLEKDILNEARGWLNQVIDHGRENFSKVKHDNRPQSECFKELWMGEKHKQVLDQF